MHPDRSIAIRTYPAPPHGAARMGTAVLLHGLGRTARAMMPAARFLCRHGFDVLNVDYPSRGGTIARLSKTLGESIRRHLAPDETNRVFFVTHSLGGILLRRYLLDHPWPELRAVVMLSPPHHGSEVADRLARYWAFRKILGPALVELSTSSGGGPAGWPAWKHPAPLGIIAGTRSLDPWFASLFVGSHDGKVAVARAKMEGMADFIALPVAHPFIMRHPQSLRQILHFFRTGHFEHSPAEYRKSRGSGRSTPPRKRAPSGLLEFRMGS